MIELKGVCKSYANVRAVQDLSFAVSAGEIMGLIGPNGAGKSTTLRMILNIIKPDAGTITIHGKPLDRTELPHIGYLPEERGLYRKTVVMDILRYYAALHGSEGRKTDERILDWLERFGLMEWKDRKVEELSKGMAQKVQFISCMAHDPDLIILDEPFSGLDPVSTEVLISAMGDLSRAGKSILFSTHIMEHAERLCQNILMLHKGREVCSGSLGEIQNRFGTKSVSLEFDGDGSFLADLPFVTGSRIYAREAEVQLASEGDSQRLYKELVDRLSVRRFEMRQPSLHNIFLKLAGADALDQPAEETSAAGSKDSKDRKPGKTRSPFGFRKHAKGGQE